MFPMGAYYSLCRRCCQLDYLLSKSREMFSMPEGFYPLESIFLLRMTAREGNQ
jgi:hypothetical protein